MKKVLILFLLLLSLLIWFSLPKITSYYTQLTKPRVGLNLGLQPKAQKKACFVGS